ncbi:MAG TPA: hypothetical protein VFL92_05510 [Sphingomonas sp.]|nr:hypothetical protein [Sphingomonas sp.]
MGGREIHLERLIGCKVHDSAGRSAGRIEEIEAELQGGEWVVVSIMTGPIGLLTRLSSLGIGAWLLGLLGARKLVGGYEIGWRQLDLHDPARPRLLCPVGELQRL